VTTAVGEAELRWWTRSFGGIGEDPRVRQAIRSAQLRPAGVFRQ